MSPITSPTKKKRPTAYYPHEFAPGSLINPRTFDTETHGLNGKLLCATYCYASSIDDPDYQSGIYTEQAEEKLCNLMLMLGGVWYAHNSQYDIRYFIETIKAMGLYMKLLNKTPQELLAIKVYISEAEANSRCKPLFEIRDSFALFPKSLDDFSKKFAAHLPKIKGSGPDFEAGEIWSKENPDHVAYAIRDAVSLRESLIKFQEMVADKFGCNLGMTAAGTAMKAWQATIEKPYFCLTAEKEEFFDKAYFGGLVFLTSTEIHQNAVAYDINSSYPAKMLEGVPTGSPKYTARYKGDDVPAFYRVSVKAPENLIVPILPCRDERTGGVRWPRGNFETHITNLEIEFACKHGYEIQVHEGYFFSRIEKIFDAVVNVCMQLRWANKKQALEDVAKLIQSSCYGKFATKRERENLILTDDPMSYARENRHLLPIDVDAGVYAEMTKSDDMPRMPHWAAWITAAARMNLLDFVYSCGPENCLYGDTDSVTLKEGVTVPERFLDEKIYGKFKIDKEWIFFRAEAPKVYSGFRWIKKGEFEGYAYDGKAKGITQKLQTPQFFEAVFHGTAQPVKFQSMPKLVQILKNRKFTLDDGSEKIGSGVIGAGTITCIRSMTTREHVANWQYMKNGAVRPKILQAA